MRTLKADVLVIGSGFGAAPPALRLSAAGKRVLMIEKGPDIVPERDFRQTQDPAYLRTYLKGMSSDTVSFTYAEGLGGGSGFYEMVSLRAPRKTFEQTDESGRRYWPEGVDRAAMDPFYRTAERMLHVRQLPEHRVPKTGVAFSHLMKNLGYSCDRARYAVRACVGSGYCVTGCIFNAKESLHQNYLPEAREAGLEVVTGTEAVRIRPLARARRCGATRAPDGKETPRFEVRCRKVDGSEEFVVRAHTVVLGGGTIGTAKLLLDSAADLPELGPHAGSHIAFNGSVKAAGLLPDGFIEGDMFTGMSHSGMISYQFWEDRGITVSAAKPLPLYLVTAARIAVEGETRRPATWGPAHVEIMKRFRRRMMVLYTLGLTPPAARLRRLGPGRFAPELRPDERLKRYHREASGLLRSILAGNGCRLIDARPTNLEGEEYRGLHFDTTHMVGSARMADRCADGVVNANGEAFHYPGLYVTDGAAVPTSLGVNSALTILANAERIAAAMAAAA